MKKTTKKSHAEMSTRARVKIAGLTVTKDAKPTPAFWRDMFKMLSEETEPKILPGVEADIETDLTGNGGNAYARRVGLNYLTKPFSELAPGMGRDRKNAEIWLDLAQRIDASAKAHRKVADLLEMANTRIFAGLSVVSAKVDRMPRTRRRAA